MKHIFTSRWVRFSLREGRYHRKRHEGRYICTQAVLTRAWRLEDLARTCASLRSARWDTVAQQRLAQYSAAK